MTNISYWMTGTLTTIFLIVSTYILAKKKHYILSVVPAATVIILLICGGIYAGYVCQFNEMISDEFVIDSENTASMEIVRNEKTGETVFSNITIKNEKDETIDIDNIYVGEKIVSDYESAAEYFVKKHSLEGDSIDPSLVSEKYFKMGNVYVEPNLFFKNAAVVLALMIVIEMIQISMAKKKQLKEEMEMMKKMSL